MKLSQFITEHTEQILVEWEAFARKQAPAATGMSDLALRDHAKQILETAVADMDTTQTDEQQEEKSKGLAPTNSGGDSAATTHGELRHLHGFSLDQLLAEYRALRATVIRLWQNKITDVTDTTSDEMTRFHEAMDQAIAESAAAFAEKTSRTRDLFLGILGHDLRGPMSTLSMAGEILSMAVTGTDQTRALGLRIKRSTAAMTAMINDLLEYSRTQLGAEIPVNKSLGDLTLACEAALDDARAGHPACNFELEASGNLNIAFDGHRMPQVLSNLLNNAAQYRSGDWPVTMTARGEAEMVVVEVRNHGPVISRTSLENIFDPLVRLSGEDKEAPRTTNLGLGLFIARQITEAHGGKISVTSSEHSGTTFTVYLPRI